MSGSSSPLSASITPPQTTPSSPIVPPTAPPSHLPHYVTTKLTQDNYLIWSAQVKAYLQGQLLFGNIDGSNPQPPPRTPSGLPNKSYLSWFQQDKLVLSILLASLSDKIIPQFIRHQTSRAMWQALETSFSQQTQARIVHLHQQITTLKKGGESISEYHRRAIILADSLAAAGKPVADDDFVTYLLAGLGPEFDIIVTVLSTQRSSLSVEAILSHLLTFEERLTHQNSVSLPTEITANTVYRTSPDFFSRGGRGGRSHRSGQGFNNFSGRWSGSERGFRGPYRGRGAGRTNRGRGRYTTFYPRNNFSPDNTIQCQICELFGHTAKTCYDRSNHAVQAPPPPSLSAHYSEFSSMDDSLWYPDTGPTHHMTDDFSRLNLVSEPYHGNDSVIVSNGTPMAIQNQGAGTLNANSGRKHKDSSSSWS